MTAVTAKPEPTARQHVITVAGLWLTTMEAAEILRVCEATVRRRAAAGDLRARKIGREWRVWAEDVLDPPERVRPLPALVAPPGSRSMGRSMRIVVAARARSGARSA